VDAAAELARAGVPFRLRIVGDGTLRRELEGRVNGSGLTDHVRFEGDLQREEVARVLAEAPLFAPPCTVVAEQRHDGLPVAILEAMAAGLPVVSTPVGGIPEAIVSGLNGLLVPGNDVRALASALAGLLGDDDARRRLGAAARETALRRFDLRASARRLADWMRESDTHPRSLPKVRQFPVMPGVMS